MSSSASVAGLRSDAMLAALDRALGGDVRELEQLLARHGGLPNPTPNLRLAAAFGVELSAAIAGPKARQARTLLDRLSAEDAAEDDARAFLPIAAAHGWAGAVRVGREVEHAWTALAPLAADERAPVRLGTRDALAALAQRPGGADELVRRASAWLDDGAFDDDDRDARETRFGSAATVIEVFNDGRLVSSLGNFEALLTYLSRAIAAAADAPRSAERSDARRRVLLGLPRTLATIAASSRAGERGAEWLEAECADARHPQVREALERALERLKKPGAGESGTNVSLRALQTALAGSAKPPRDPTRIRPGKGRGKRPRARK